MRSKVAETGHATGLAALIAATENNSIGGRGIAPAATLISLNAIASGDDSRLVQALQVALVSGASVINNSWSPPDPNEGGSRSFYPAPQAWYSALDEAQSKGRSGLGAIIVKAAGNGGAALSPSRLRSDSADSANYDGYAQHPAVISVGAVDAFARPLTVSEPGAQVLVSAFSSQTNSPSLSTGTEVLPSGTSSAAAMVSALSALMLEANPGLTWRDLRWILATTARPIPGYDQPGISSAQSLLRSHGYHQQVGFGLIDAGAAVQSAKSFQGLPPLMNCLLDAEKNAPIITRAGTGEQLALPWQQVAIDREYSKISFSFDLAKAQCPIDRIESLMLSLASSHQDATGLRITLISPLGYGVQFAAPRDCAHTVCTNLNQGFRFHSVRFMAEPAAGRWTLQISEESGKSIGTLSRLQLSFLGH
jgi:kexin